MAGVTDVFSINGEGCLRQAKIGAGRATAERDIDPDLRGARELTYPRVLNQKQGEQLLRQAWFPARDFQPWLSDFPEWAVDPSAGDWNAKNARIRGRRGEEVHDLMQCPDPAYWAATGRCRPVRHRRVRYYEHANDRLGMWGDDDEYQDARQCDIFATRHVPTAVQSLPGRSGYQMPQVAVPQGNARDRVRSSRSRSR